MPTAPVRILFAERLPAAVGTPEPLFDKPTYATSAKIIASRGRVVNTGAVYLGQRTVFDSTLNIAVDNGTATGLTTAATSQDRTGDKRIGPQVEAATVAGTITSGTRQVETATVAGTITSGTKQVETATVVGTITAAGNAKVVITGALVGDSPKEILVDVALSDNASAIAGKIRSALNIAPITTHYTVGGSGADITLTAKVEAANDATLNISIENGTCEGITDDTSSANTTAGVSPGTMAVTITSGTKQVETATVVGTVTGDGDASVVVTSAIVTGSPLTVAVPVLNTDTAEVVAGKIRAALTANPHIATKFTVGGATDKVVLTALEAAANDTSLNISIDNGTCTGLTTAASSANTTAGVARSTHLSEDVVIQVPVAKGDTATALGTKLRAALAANAVVAAGFTISGAAGAAILTAKVSAADDATLNVAIDNGTCTGVTPAATSVDTTAGVAAGTAKVTVTGAGIAGSPLDVTAAVALDDDAATVAGKLRAALENTAAVTALYGVGGSGAEIVLTRKDVILNDTMKYPMAAGATLELEAGEDGTLDLSQIVVDAVTLGDGVQIVYTQPARF
jgi:hypothetical protein